MSQNIQQNQNIEVNRKIPIVPALVSKKKKPQDHDNKQKSSDEMTSSLPLKELSNDEYIARQGYPIVRMCINPLAETLIRPAIARRKLSELKGRLKNFEVKLDGSTTYNLVSNLALGITQNGKRIRYHFKCHIPRCSYQNMDEALARIHIGLIHDDLDWNGYCSKCRRFISERTTISDELKHIIECHMNFNPARSFESLPPAAKIEQVQVAAELSLTYDYEANACVAQILKNERIEKEVEKLINFSIKKEAVPDSISNLEHTLAPKRRIEHKPTVASNETPPTYDSINFSRDIEPQMASTPKVSSRDPRLKKLLVNHVAVCNVQPWLKESKGLKERSAAHKMLVQEPLAALYKCMEKDCSFFSNNPENFRFHSNMHQTEAFRCSYCSFEGTRVDDFVKHIGVHSLDAYQCGYCFYRCVCQENLIVHAKRFHSAKKVIIIIELSPPGHSEHREKLQKQTRDYEIFTKYISEFKCLCTASFHIFEDFQNHIKTHGNFDQIHNCECGEKVSFKDLIEHNEKRHKVAQMQCVYCKFGCPQLDQIYDHLSACHPSELPFFCDRTKNTSKYDSFQLKCLGLKSVEVDDEEEDIIVIN